MGTNFNLNRCTRLDCGTVDFGSLPMFHQKTIALATGELVQLEDLYQFHTYHGWLCGMPTESYIPGFIDRAVGTAKKIFPQHFHARIAVFAPVISFGRSAGIGSEGPSQLEEWAVLPPVTTIAVLKLTDGFDSVLAIWYQDQVGYPDAAIVNQIQELDWHRHVVEIDP